MAAPLLFIAASGLAREALAVVRAHNLYPVAGFLDDNTKLVGQLVDGAPVLGAIETIHAYPDARLIICAGHGAARERIARRLADLGVADTRYATIVHPATEIPAGCKVGVGSIVLNGVVLTTAVQIGKHAVVMPNVTLTHDCILEDYATICAGVSLGGNVLVRSRAYVGMNACARERIVIGSDATLGMGAALIEDLPAGEMWGGIPARPLRSPKR